MKQFKNYEDLKNFRSEVCCNLELFYENKDLKIHVFFGINKKRNKPQGVFYSGNKNKPYWNYIFLNKNDFLTNYKESLDILIKQDSDKKRRKLEKNNYIHNVKIGDIFHHSYGYNQTNCHFYQVVSLKGKKSINLRETCAKVIDGSIGLDSNRLLPDKNVFRKGAKIFTKRIIKNYNNNDCHISIDCGWCSRINQKDLEKGFFNSWGH